MSRKGVFCRSGEAECCSKHRTGVRSTSVRFGHNCYRQPGVHALWRRGSTMLAWQQTVQRKGVIQLASLNRRTVHLPSKFVQNARSCVLRYLLTTVVLCGCARATRGWDGRSGDGWSGDRGNGNGGNWDGGDSNEWDNVDASTAADSRTRIDAELLPLDGASTDQQTWSYVIVNQNWLPYEVRGWGGRRTSYIYGEFLDFGFVPKGYRFEAYHEGECTVERSRGSLSSSVYRSAGTLTVVTNGNRMTEVEGDWQNGMYAYFALAPNWTAGDRIVVSASGDQVPAFSVELEMPLAVEEVTGLGRPGEALRIAARDGLTIEWGGTSAPYVWLMIVGNLPDGGAWDRAAVNCHFSGRSRRGVVPPAVLERLRGGRMVASVRTADVRLLRVGRYMVHVSATNLVHATGEMTVE